MDAEIETWWQLQQLMTRYANACDDRDWATYRTLFTADARIDYTEAYGRAGTVDEIAPWMEKIMDFALLPSSQHLLANLVFERAGGDRASGRAQYFNPDVFVENDRRIGLINGGVYRFEARRDDGRWRLSYLHAKLLWSTRAELTEFTPAE
jgi:hypothetical protein